MCWADFHLLRDRSCCALKVLYAQISLIILDYITLYCQLVRIIIQATLYPRDFDLYHFRYSLEFKCATFAVQLLATVLCLIGMFKSKYAKLMLVAICWSFIVALYFLTLCIWSWYNRKPEEPFTAAITWMIVWIFLTGLWTYFTFIRWLLYIYTSQYDAFNRQMEVVRMQDEATLAA